MNFVGTIEYRPTLDVYECRFRTDLGHYGAYGITREDALGRAAAGMGLDRGSLI